MDRRIAYNNEYPYGRQRPISSHRIRSRSRSPQRSRGQPFGPMLQDDDFDFARRRREIDIEMRRMDEEEKRRYEARRFPENPQKDDLRYMLDKSRAFSPPPLPPLRNEMPPYHSPRKKIQVFDYTRLGDKSSEIKPPKPLEVLRDESFKPRDNNSKEKLIDTFSADCDTVAFVTQMFIDEDPTLEEPLVKALRGVLQKVMDKHLSIESK